MTKSHALTAAVFAALLADAKSADAATQLFGFNDATLNGFELSFTDTGTATVSRSTTTGVSEGSSALRISPGPSDGFTQTQVIIRDAEVPSALIQPGTTSNTLDVTTNYGGSNFLFIDEVFFIDGTGPSGQVLSRRIDPAVSQNNPLSPANTAMPQTLTFNLKNYADPFRSFTNTPAGARFTPGEIVANVIAAGGNVSVSGFAFNLFNGATNANLPTGAADPGVDFYLDNFTVPVPEPTALAGLALGGVLATRRRRGR